LSFSLIGYLEILTTEDSREEATCFFTFAFILLSCAFVLIGFVLAAIPLAMALGARGSVVPAMG